MTRDIELALAKGKIVGATKLLQEYFEKEDRQKFEAKLRAEYDELFPSTREMTDAEKSSEYISDCMYRDDMDWEHIPIEDFTYQKVTIDYSADETYVTFEDYKNETRVISEATYDEDGNQLTEEVTELVRPYVKPSNIDELVENYIASSYAELRKIEYPDLGDQLDMLYKDMINGTNTWLETIRQIKEKYPKVEA